MSKDADRIASWALDGLSTTNLLFKVPGNVISNFDSIALRCVNIVIQLTSGSWEDAGGNYAAILSSVLGDLPTQIDMDNLAAIKNKAAALAFMKKRNAERTGKNKAAALDLLKKRDADRNAGKTFNDYVIDSIKTPADIQAEKDAAVAAAHAKKL